MKLLYVLIILLIIAQYFDNNRMKRTTRLVKFLNKRDKILDLGCGDCCNTKYLKNMGYKNIVGLDVVNEGKCMIPKLYDGKKIPYKDNSFDVIICSFVLHHIPDYDSIIKEMKRVTRKFILIHEDTPEYNVDYFFTKLHAKSDWGKCKRCFNKKRDWLEIFRKHNLKITYIKDISRFELPFAKCPIIYPVPTTFFVLQKN